MIIENQLSKGENRFIATLLVLMLVGFFYQLGIYPLFLEEPRRSMIALEMILNDNYWVPTVLGEYYYKKPPFYNWLIVVSYQVFGFDELASRVVSILSHLALSGLIFVFARKRLGLTLALYAALAYVLSVDILFYYSLLGEIDLFYALVTALSIFAIYHYGEKKQYWKLFLLVYLLASIGFLTKGITSLPYAAISLLVYFVMKKKFKVLLSIYHIAGILLFFALIGGYFWKYSQYAPVEDWLNTLYNESAEKATRGGFLTFLKHFFTFPFVIIGIACPATLLLPLAFKKEYFKKLRQNEFVWFCLLVFGFNFLLYWVSTQARTRYVYPIMPFLMIAMTYVLSSVSIRGKYLTIASRVSLVLVALGISSVFFIPNLESVKLLNISLIVLLLLIAGLVFLNVKKVVNPYLIIMGLLVVLKIGVSSIVPVTRKYDSNTAKDVSHGKKVAEMTAGEPIYRYGQVKFKLTTGYYMERDKMSILKKVDHFNEKFYMVYEKDLPKEKKYKVITRIPDDYNEIFLIEML